VIFEFVGWLIAGTLSAPRMNIERVPRQYPLATQQCYVPLMSAILDRI
jgi:hypothetical protein